MNNLSVEGDSVIVKVNTNLYTIDVIYSAAYVFLDKAYVLLDGDPSNEVIVKLKSKSGEDLEKLGGEFLNELINYADYNSRAGKTRKIREMIMQRALLTNDPNLLRAVDGKDKAK